MSIPDICGKAEYPDIEKTAVRYIKGYDNYVGKYEKPSNTDGGDMHYSSGDIIHKLRTRK